MANIYTGTGVEVEEWLQAQKNNPDAEYHQEVCEFFTLCAPRLRKRGSLGAKLTYEVHVNADGDGERKLTLMGDFFV